MLIGTETRFLVDPSPRTKEPSATIAESSFVALECQHHQITFRSRRAIENSRINGSSSSPPPFSFLSPRAFSSSKNRAEGGCVRCPNKKATGYWTLQGQFSSTMSSTLFSSVCVLLRKSRVTQVYPVSSAGAVTRHPPVDVKGIPAPEECRYSFQVNDEEEWPDARAP